MPDGLRQREPRVEDKAFLAFVRARGCCVPACGAPPRSHAAHVRMACPERGKRETGKGERPSDCWAVPLCHDCHQDGPAAQHKGAEAAFWRRVGVDPFALAVKLYDEFLDGIIASGVSRVKRDVDSGRKSKVSSRPGARHRSSGFPKRPSQVKRAIDSAAKVRRPKRKWPSPPLRGMTRWPKRKMRRSR
jgi:hypothetical protein